MCPANQIVVGFEGRQGSYIDQLIFHCAPLTITGGPEAYTLSVGTVISIPPLGGPGGIVTFPPITCTTDAIAVGTIVRAGTAIDGFALICAAPSLVLAP
jgi:hypothetical protein